MELFSLDRDFKKQEIFDVFNSSIWTERYFGDGDFELNIPYSEETLAKLMPGTFVGENSSEEPMITEDYDIKNGNLKVTGISLTQWLDNRFIRTTPDPKINKWVMHRAPGQAIADIVQNWCIDSVYLTDPGYTSPGGVFTMNDPGMGMVEPARFKLPGLFIKETDVIGPEVDLEIPFEPVYGVIKAIGQLYGVGMRTTFEYDSPTDIVGFRTYRGVDRTSPTSSIPILFSIETQSLSDLQELRSIKNYKTRIYSYAPEVDLATFDWAHNEIQHGFNARVGPEIGWNVRAEAIVSNITENEVENIVPPTDWGVDLSNADRFVRMSSNEVIKYAITRHVTNLVDGQIDPNGDFQYGRDYGMGDIVELKGYTGARQKARVTEFIRTQDASGEKAYPTIEIIEE